MNRKNAEKKTARRKIAPPQTKICQVCQKERSLKTDYYMSNSPLHGDGKVTICKQCIKEMVDIDNDVSVKNMLRALDKPFIYSLWESSKQESNKDPFGIYLKNVALNHKYDTWEQSVFHPSDESKNKDNYYNINNKFEVTEELIEKWGEGYTPEEYRSFERKYQMLKNNYQEKTAMHREALLTYIRYRVKEELATAKGQVKEAKDWGALAQQAATNAKINPSQLSKSDLSDGLDTFGQLVRTVEQAVDIIPILPKFKERPQDKVDFTLWCYINYIRDLKGLPLAKYEEIYKFYEQRKKEYEMMQQKEEIEGEE